MKFLKICKELDEIFVYITQSGLKLKRNYGKEIQLRWRVHGGKNGGTRSAQRPAHPGHGVALGGRDEHVRLRINCGVQTVLAFQARPGREGAGVSKINWRKITGSYAVVFGIITLVRLMLDYDCYPSAILAVVFAFWWRVETYIQNQRSQN